MDNQEEINDLINDVSTKLGLYLLSNININRSFIDSTLFRKNLFIIMNRFKTSNIIHELSISLLLKSIKIKDNNNIELDLSSVVTNTNTNFYFYSDLFFKLPLLTKINNNFREDKITFYCDYKMSLFIINSIKNLNNNEIIDILITDHKLNIVEIHNLKMVDFLIDIQSNEKTKTWSQIRYSATYSIFPSDDLKVTKCFSDSNIINTNGFLHYLIEHFRDILQRNK